MGNKRKKKALRKAAISEITPNDLRKHGRELVRHVRDTSKELSTSEASEYQGVLRRTSAKAALSENRTLLEMVDKIDYAVQALWTSCSTKRSYRLLIELIGSLGPPHLHAEIMTGLEDSRKLIEQHRITAIWACKRLCRLVKPHCWTAYAWNRRLNRTFPLHQCGLRISEALHGFVWTRDIPRIVMFNDKQGPISPPWPDEANGGKSGGSFRLREGIKTCYGVQLRWDRSRMSLLLNWRDGAGDPEYTPEDLDLSIRYLIGWLTAAGVDVSKDTDNTPATPTSTIVNSVNDFLKDKSEETMSRCVATTLNQIVALERGYDCLVRWIKEEGNQKYVQFPSGDYIDFAGDEAPRLSIELDKKTGLVPRGICAQAAAWHVPLLIQNLDTPIFPEDENKTWRNLGLYTNHSVSEIAAPVALGEHGAVINVEHSKPEILTEETLRRVELVARVYESLYVLDDEQTNKIEDMFTTRGSSAEGREVLSAFTKLAIELVNADFGYVLIYDHQRRSFVPMGVRIKRDRVKEYLLAKANDEFSRKAQANRYLRYLVPEKSKTEENEWSVLESICEEAVASYLTPRRRGNSWRVFTSTRPEAFPNISQGAEAGDKDQLKPCFCELPMTIKAAAALPFTCSSRAEPDGVVWLLWKERPQLGVEDEKQLLELCGPLSKYIHAFSSLYALYRYCERSDLV